MTWDQTRATHGAAVGSVLPSTAPASLPATTATPNISSGAGVTFIVGQFAGSQIVAADSNKHDIIITNRGISKVFLNGTAGGLAPAGYCLNVDESIRLNSAESIWAVTLRGRSRVDVVGVNNS